MSPSRRTLLKTTGLALSSGMLTSVAGCLGIAPTSSDNEPSPPTQSDEPAASDFTQWLPDPTKTPLRDGYGVRYFDLKSIRAHQDAIHENAYSRLKSAMEGPLPSKFVDGDDIDASVQIDHRASIALGSFDPEGFGEALTNDRQSSTAASTRTPTTATRTPWSEPERYRGFDLYGTEYVYAVSEDVFIDASPMREEDAVDYAKAIIDTQAEQAGHYADGNEYVAAMFSVLDDDPHAVWCYPEAMDGSTARGFRTDNITGKLQSWRFDDATTHLTWANTYSDAETAESGELTDYIESESDRFGTYDGLDVETTGRMAWTDGTIPTNEFDHLSAGGSSDGVSTPH